MTSESKFQQKISQEIRDRYFGEGLSDKEALVRFVGRPHRVDWVPLALPVIVSLSITVKSPWGWPLLIVSVVAGVLVYRVQRQRGLALEALLKEAISEDFHLADSTKI